LDNDEDEEEEEFERKNTKLNNNINVIFLRKTQVILIIKIFAEEASTHFGC